MAESYSVTAVLSAQDKNFSSVFGSARGAADSLAGKLKSGLGFGVLMGIGQKAVGAVTSAVSGLTNSVVETGKSFETATSQIAATMGTSKSEIQDIIAEAERLGATTKFTATQAAEGFNILAMSGFKADQQLGAAEKVLQLASAGAYDMDAAAKQLTGTMKGFQMEMNNAEETSQSAAKVADLIAKGATLAATDVDQLGVALSTASSNAKGYGQSIESTETALLRLAEQNVTGAEAATALASVQKNIFTPATDAAKDALKELGINAYDPVTHKARDFNDIVNELNTALHDQYGENDQLINQKLADIFDDRAARAYKKIVSSNVDKTNEFRDALEHASDGIGSAAQQAAEQMNNLEGDMTLFGSATDGLNNAIYKNMNVPMRAFYKVATAGITEVTGLVQKFGEKISTSIDLEALQAAIDENGLAGAVSVLSGSLGSLIPGLKAAAAAAGAFAGVGAVSGFLDSGLWKTGVSGVKTFGKSISSLKGKFADLGYGALNKASKTMPGLLTNMSKAGDAISGAFGTAKTVVADTFASAFPHASAVMKATTKVAGTTASGILSVFGKMGGALKTTMGIALKALMPAAMVGAVLVGLGVLYQQFGTQIDGMLQMAQQKGPEIISGLVQGITSMIPGLMASGSKLVSGLMSTITANIPAVVAGGVSIVTSLVLGVANAAPELIGKAVELVGTLAVSIVSALPQLITTGMTLLASLAQGVAANLPVLASYAMSAVMTFAQGIISNLPQILASAVQIVTSLVTGIVNMLPVLIGQGMQLVTYLGQSIVQNLPLIIGTGVRVIAALVAGLIQAVPMIISGAVELVKSLIDTIIHTDWIKVGGDVISAIGDGIKSGFSGIGSLVSGLFSSDTSAAEGAAQQASAAAESTAQAYLDSSSYVSDAASKVGAEAQESLAASFEGTSIDLSGIGLEAAGTVTGEFDTGLSELPGITDMAGTQVVSSLQQTGTQATTVAKRTTVSIVNALKAGINPAKTAGKSVGTGYAGGVRGETANASSAGSAVKSSALSGMSGGYSSAYSHGSNIGQGLVDGMRSKIGAAWAAANELAAAADKAIHARAQIGSPSKITIKYGGWIAEGLAVGIKDGTNGVVKQAKSLVTSLYKQMQKSTKKLGGAKDAASTYLKAFKTGLQNKAKSDLEYVENSLKKYRDVSKSYNATITALMKSYKTAYNKEVDKLINSVNTKLTNLANTYQTKYNNIINAQKDFRDTLRETSLYSADDYGNIVLADFAAQNRAIKQYESNISKLKKLLPESMMDEILGMSRENGLAYTTELLKKSADEIRAYGKQYSVVMNTSSKVAGNYYSGRLTALQKSYAADLKKIYADAQKDMDGIGKNVVQGLIDGMKSKKGALDATGRNLAEVVEKAFKKQLGIKSPSTVMTDAGEDTGQGVINGIENKIKAARAAMAALLDVTSPETEIRRRSGSMSLNDEYDYRSEASYTIVVESTLDGKKVGEGVAKFVKQKNDAVEKRESRKKGKT